MTQTTAKHNARLREVVEGSLRDEQLERARKKEQIQTKHRRRSAGEAPGRDGEL